MEKRYECGPFKTISDFLNTEPLLVKNNHSYVSLCFLYYVCPNLQSKSNLIESVPSRE